MNLLYIDISSTNIIDIGLQCLCHMDLQKLILLGCKNLTDQGLEYLSKSIKLKYIDILYCRGISDSGAMHLFVMNLQDLDIIGCFAMNVGIIYLSKLKL